MSDGTERCENEKRTTVATMWQFSLYHQNS